MTDIDTRAEAKRAAREHAAIVQNELRRIQLKLFKACEKLTDNVIASQTKPAAPAASADVERREVANILGTWQFCACRACTRSRACKGEPLRCLEASLTLLPEGMLAALVASKRRRKRR